MTLAEADGKADSLIPFADDVVRECDVCRASDVAPSTPVSGASSVAFYNGKVQVDLPLLGDIIVLHVLDISPRYSHPVPGRSKNSDEVWDAFRASRIAVFGKPRSIQMDEGSD